MLKDYLQNIASILTKQMYVLIFCMSRLITVGLNVIAKSLETRKNEKLINTQSILYELKKQFHIY